jgi:hypothetical protein
MGVVTTYLLHDVAKEAAQLRAPGAGGDGAVGLLEVVVEGGIGLLMLVALLGLLLQGFLLDVIVCEIHGCGSMARSWDERWGVERGEDLGEGRDYGG